jgi:hypothetical protein
MRAIVAFAAGLALVAAAPATASTSTALTMSKARSAVHAFALRDGAKSATVGRCRRKTERKIVCSVALTGTNGTRSTVSYLAYRNSKGHVAVKRTASAGNNQAGPGAPLT